MGEKEGEKVGRLSTPQRWKKNPELGLWLSTVREKLGRAEGVSIRHAPSCIQRIVVPGVSSSPDAWSTFLNARVSGYLHRLLDERSDTLLVLTYHRAHARGITKALQRRKVPLFEGADSDDGYRFLERCEGNRGKPAKLVEDVLWLLKKTSSGITRVATQAIQEVCPSDCIRIGRKRKWKAFAECMKVVYEQPDAWSACIAVRRVCHTEIEWLDIRFPETLRMIGRVEGSGDESIYDAFERVVQAKRRMGRVPRRAVMTIHRSKGREAAHVIIVHGSEKCFPDTPEGRRLLYVGLTRALESVTILTPETGATPLIVS